MKLLLGHNMCTDHQDSARDERVRNMSFLAAALTLDWSQKILPSKLVEQQAEFLVKLVAACMAAVPSSKRCRPTCKSKLIAGTTSMQLSVRS